jgi:hypothetical protein
MDLQSSALGQDYLQLKKRPKSQQHGDWLDDD